MKKTFKTFALMLLTAFAFSSCVDVPAPFELPNNSSKSSGGSSSEEEEAAITCAEAVNLVNALADGASSTETYSIVGYITNIGGAVSTSKGAPQQSFWIADTKDGGKIFQAYYAYVPDGVTEFKVGLKVTITGKLKKYVNKNTGAVTPEMENPTVKILEDDGSGSSGSGSSGSGSSSSDGSQIADFTSGQGSWTVNDANGSGIWTNSSQYGMVASGFINNTSQASESWLISPEIDLTSGTNCKIILSEAINHIKTGSIADQCQVYACINDGQTNWQLLTADKRPAGTGWTYQDDTFDASAFDGKKILLAFKYVSTESSAPSWEIKTVKIKGVESSSQGNDSGNGGNGGGATVTSLVNGGFESWGSDTEATGWKSTSTVSSANVSKSSEARSGNFACIVKPSTGNARLATQEITLEAGSYTFSYYAKSTTADVCQTYPGYAVIGGSTPTYYYPKDGNNKTIYVDLNNNEWTLVSYDFDLTEQTTICLIVMNPKAVAGKHVSQDILVDDATLTKN